MTLTLGTTHEAAGAKRFSCLIYGKPGVGKTSLAVTVPNYQTDLVILNTEGGMAALRKHPPIACLTANRWPDIQQAIQWLPQAAAEKGWKWLFVDSLVEMAELCVKHHKSILVSKYKNDGRAMYGGVLEDMTQACKDLRDMDGYNVVMLAHPKPDKDYEGRTVMGIDIAGQASHRIVGWFDEVYSFRIIQGADGQHHRWLITQEHDGWIAKTRDGTLAMFEPPNLSSIAAKMFGPQDAQ